MEYTGRNMVLLVGCPRSGTTWLSRALAKHPEVFHAQPFRPEPKFFLIDDLYANGLQYYSDRWFQVADGYKAVGEKSTNYLESPVAAERIAKDLPGVKLIFLLRDPCERAYSNYLWTKMNGLETLEFGDALRAESEREKSYSPDQRYSRPYSYYSRGLYAEMLRPYLDRFPGESILCLRCEEMDADPGKLLSQVHTYLGVLQRPDDAKDLGKVNSANLDQKPMPKDLHGELKQRFAEPNHALARLLGDRFSVWKY